MIFIISLVFEMGLSGARVFQVLNALIILSVLAIMFLLPRLLFIL